MDPVSALSVASSVIQIVDFSAKLFSHIYEVYESESGGTAEHTLIKRETEQVRILNGHLTRAVDPGKLERDLTPLEIEVVSLARECDDAAVQLTEKLESVSLDTQKGKAWAAVRSAVKSVWRQRDIDRLRQRLDSCRQLLTTSILVQLQ
jgi:hypothetical protein